jgi:hypothetical protein
MKKRSEHEEQVDFFDYVRKKAIEDIRYRNIYAVPNAGKRTHAQRIYMLKEGLEPGVWDISIDWPSGQYHGMKIEMKLKGKKLTKPQKIWQKRYKTAGYFSIVCYSHQEAIWAADKYMEGKNGRP